MEETTLQLRQATNAVAESLNPKEKLSALKHAFETFSAETTRLETAYLQLKNEFKSVNGKLESTVGTLNEKVRELDITTQYLNSILSHMTQGIVVIAPSGLVTTYNPAAEKILGFQEKDILFHPFWNYFSDDLFGFSLKKALYQEAVPQTTLIHYEHNNASLILEVTVNFVLSPVEWREETLAQNVILLIRDITEMHRLQKIASLNDRMQELGEMAASVAHEIRNPLGGIKGFAALLKRDLEDQPHLQKMAEYIVDGADSLNRLVTNVLNYSRPIQLQFELKDLVEETKIVLDMVRFDPQVPSHISFSLVAPKEKVYLCLDRQLFRSALLNLLINAVQATQKGGQVTLTLSQDKETATLMIADQGVGIAQENLAKIFSPFFTTKVKGNGFGLSEVHKIIQAHGGEIDVTSEQGAGSTFTIKLPLKH